MSQGKFDCLGASVVKPELGAPARLRWLLKRTLGPARTAELNWWRSQIGRSRPIQFGSHVLTDAAATFGWPGRIWYDDVLSFAPHPPGLYDFILEQLQSSGRLAFARARELHSGCVSPVHVNLVLRHDLDNEPEKLLLFVRPEQRLGLTSSIYVRVDGEAYDPGRVAKLLTELHDAGFEIGLHTAAYTADDPLGTLEAELRRFRETFHFAPLSLNTHGVVTRGLDVRPGARRRAFLQGIERQADRYGLIVTDHSIPGTYDIIAGDANLRLNRRVSYQTRDVLTVPRLPAGCRVLWLTHPEYWIKSTG